MPDPPSAGGAHSLSPAPPLPKLPMYCPQALPIGAAPAPAAPYHQPPLLHYSPAVHQPASQYCPHPRPAPHAVARSPYKGHAVVHRSTQRAAEAPRLIAPARLSTAKDDLYLRMATFSSALRILSAIRAAQTGDQVANVLMANAARWGAEGEAVAAALADCRVPRGRRLSHPGGRDLLVVRQAATAVRGGPPRRHALCRGGHRHRVHGRCPARHPRGPRADHGPGQLLDGPSRGRCDSRPPGGPQGDRDRAQAPRGMSSLPAWARAATRHVPGAVPPLPPQRPSAKPGHWRPQDEPATPPIPAWPLSPPGVVPYAMADGSGSNPLARVDRPRPTPAAGPLGAPAPVPRCRRPLADGIRGPGPPMGSPTSRQLVIEVSGRNPETMMTAAVRDA